ncbi:phage-related integrase [Cupriavidus sp. TA19]|uniref:tyrosine-type recombinase/integrase n=1 Tax=unclassified Cupriavidus TaxID=2640874 RepID=UPI0027294337|nr:tyrosine-type recombinase/integrase [Cupriavidus sp. TA19]GLC92235.1 phage-related integrase [Cupriavidus sp. TA19]
MSQIDTKARRAALASRSEPYYDRLAPGLFIGVRVLPDGVQTWTARARDKATGKQQYKALGTLTDATDDKRYARACDLAREFGNTVAAGLSGKPFTISDAVTNYVAKLATRSEDAADRARRSLARSVLAHATLPDMPLAELDRKTWAAFRVGLLVVRPKDGEPLDEAKRRARATATRDLTYVRAALNHAYDEGHVGSRDAWSLGAFADTHARRTLFLSPEQRRALLAAAGEEIRPFVRGLLLSAFRPGELARLTVADFDAAAGLCNLRWSKTGPRTVVLPPDAVRLFREQCKGKLPAAPIFARADGSGWQDANFWNPRVKAAGKAAGLPDTFCAYVLRHTAISALLEGGAGVLLVARLAGTSLDQINKHYGHLSDRVAREQLGRIKIA